MEVLRNDGEIVLIENLLASDNRIEGPETGIIQCHYILGNTQIQQSLFHIQRFVVITGIVIAAENNVFDFAFFKQPGSSLHSVFKEQIFLTLLRLFTRSQYQRYIIAGEIVDGEKVVGTCIVYHPEVTEQDENQADKC